MKWESCLNNSTQDSTLDGKKVLHRCAIAVYARRSPHQVQSYTLSLERLVSKRATCIDVDDKSSADFYATLFHENEVLRSMIFLPRSILSRLLLNRGTDNKKPVHLLYPSTISPETPRSREKQSQTLPYEIDLQQPLYSGPERDKFLRILNGEMG